MQEIINTELLKITMNPLKKRIYWTLQGFWQEDAEKAARLQIIVLQLARQTPTEGTVVLDTIGLRIMHPNVADLFLHGFTRFLTDTRIKALAHVRDPKNVVLKMQLQRVLRSIEKAYDVPNKSFLERQDAEDWLDTICFGMSVANSRNN
jgi:hypothetical protein